MGALPPAVGPSLASAYAPTPAWLANDTADPTGKAPVTTGPVEPVGNAVNGTAPVPLSPSPIPWTGEAELSASPPDYFSESAFPHMGPWPALPAEADGKEPLGTLPPDGMTPAGYYKVPPAIEGLVQRKHDYPGHNRHSQDVNSAGWEQHTPSGRTAVLQQWEQDYPGVDFYWPVTTPTVAPVRLARGANQAVGGVVATYGGLADSGGNTAYEVPPPPATTTIPPAAGAGTVPQWGF